MAPKDGQLEAEQLARVPFLAELSLDEIESIRPISVLRELAQGEVVFCEGDPGSELFLVLEGEIAIELDTGGNEPTLLTTLGRGTVFGEVNFLLATTRTATARALRDTRCVVLEHEALGDLRGAGSRAAARIMEKLARVLALRLAHVDRQVAELGRRFTEAHPEAARLVEDFQRERLRLLHGWEG